MSKAKAKTPGITDFVTELKDSMTARAAVALINAGVPAKHVSGITPLEYKVLVKPIEETGTIEFKSGHKLWKPDETKERDEHASMEGEVIAISPLAFSYEQGAPKPSIGDRVVFARYSGTNIKGNDGISYRLMNDKDVIAIRTGAR